MEQRGRQLTVSMAQLGLIAGSRAIVGAALGMLVADRLTAEQRQAVGWSMFLVGVIISIPVTIEFMNMHQNLENEQAPELPRREAA